MVSNSAKIRLQDQAAHSIWSPLPVNGSRDMARIKIVAEKQTKKKKRSELDGKATVQKLDRRTKQHTQFWSLCE